MCNDDYVASSNCVLKEEEEQEEEKEKEVEIYLPEKPWPIVSFDKLGVTNFWELEKKRISGPLHEHIFTKKLLFFSWP